MSGGLQRGAAAAARDLARLRRGDGADAADAVAQERIALATELFRTADKLARAQRTYRRGHPMLETLVDEWVAALHAITDRYDRVRFALGPTSIALDGYDVHQTDRVDDNIWFPLFGDGVRSMSFDGEFDRAGAFTLFEILARVGDRKSFEAFADEDDSVTLLWEADIPGLSFVATSSRSEGAADEDDEQLARVREMIRLSTLKELAGAALTGRAYAEGEVVRRMHKVNLSSADMMFLRAENLAALDELPASPRDALADLMRIARDDADAMARAIGDDPALADRFRAAVLAALDVALDAGDVRALVRAVELVVDAHARRDQWTAVAALVAATAELRRRRRAEGVPDAVADALNAPVVSRAAAVAAVGALASEAADPDALLAVLDGMSDDDAGAAAERTAAIANGTLRRRAIGICLRRGRGAVDAVAAQIAAWPADAALDALAELAEWGGDGAVRAAEAAGDHADGRVRAEAFRCALALAAEGEAARMAQRGLRSPDASVRRAACEHIATARPPGSARWLRERIDAPDFAGSEAVEKRRLFLALADVAGPDDLAWVRERLNQRNTLRRRAVDEERAAAALALGRARYEPARDDLARLAGSRRVRDVVRDACARALEWLDRPAEPTSVAAERQRRTTESPADPAVTDRPAAAPTARLDPAPTRRADPPPSPAAAPTARLDP
ncbi:MAG: hypothetical protein D6689_05970, partial [Deltaproteobacteria bacterium]